MLLLALNEQKEFGKALLLITLSALHLPKKGHSPFPSASLKQLLHVQVFDSSLSSHRDECVYGLIFQWLQFLDLSCGKQAHWLSPPSSHLRPGGWGYSSSVPSSLPLPPSFFLAPHSLHSGSSGPSKPSHYFTERFSITLCLDASL